MSALKPIHALAALIGLARLLPRFRDYPSEAFRSIWAALVDEQFWMYSLPLAAVFVGFLELMMREQAAITRSPDHKIGFDR
jgi:hypothetical protein